MNIILDEMKKEGRPSRNMMLLAYLFAALVPIFRALDIWKTCSAADVAVISIFCFLIGSVGLYGWVYALKYSLEITGDRLTMRTLFGRYNISLRDVDTYSWKRYKKTVFYRFELCIKGEKILVYTRFKEEFLQVLSEHNIEGIEELRLDSRQSKAVTPTKHIFISRSLIGISILALPISFVLSCRFGEVEIFSIGGMIRYSWIMLLFVPVELMALLYGLYLRKKRCAYKGVCIAALICLPLLVVIGSFQLLYGEVDCSAKPIQVIEEKIDFDLPDRIKVSTLPYGEYVESRAKILDAQEKQSMEAAFASSDKWTPVLSTKIKNALPFEIGLEINGFAYFLFYNETTDEFNRYPQSPGSYSCVFLAYDAELGRFLLLNEFILVDA